MGRNHVGDWQCGRVFFVSVMSKIHLRCPLELN